MRLFRRHKKKSDYSADGLHVTGRNLSFLTDARFSAAWETSREANLDGWNGDVPDVRWRTLTCITAARRALLIKGDFVECGVHTGIFSVAICRYLDFAKLNREFFLFDTFEGIPTSELADEETKLADKRNIHYFDCYAIAQRNFAPYPNAKLVRGKLPETRSALGDRAIAYLSVDLNTASYEMAVIERLWNQLSKGAVIVLDDYGFRGHERQYEAWNHFAEERGNPIFYLPTGQGLIFV
jgi:O-methyltransferase